MKANLKPLAALGAAAAICALLLSAIPAGARTLKQKAHEISHRDAKMDRRHGHREVKFRRKISHMAPRHPNQARKLVNRHARRDARWARKDARRDAKLAKMKRTIAYNRTHRRHKRR